TCFLNSVVNVLLFLDIVDSLLTCYMVILLALIFIVQLSVAYSEGARRIGERKERWIPEIGGARRFGEKKVR
ncbi:hypothetical protein N0O92_20060, partial [Alkalihalobacillus sp. MEB130]|uniref:hypothetical protein n=1 Tax=Alkalihalobacillus sp. MEB130 TaxID=2976704 RepID=UPI0028DF740B